jgi:general stress protein 26
MQTSSEDELRHRIRTELQRAPHDRHHEWRTPVLSTVDRDGVPDARTVVLRHVDDQASTLHFYTDRRSPKVSALTLRPDACVVFWSKRLSWQLRAYTRITVLQDGPAVQVAWARVQGTAAAGDYLSEHPPGSPLRGAANGASAAGPVHHLAVLQAEVTQWDWLELSRAGHRRAVFSANAWEWRVP